MKKTYTKPDVMYESFAMSNSIASGCTVKVGHEENTCGIELTSDISIFTSAVSGCTMKFEDGQYDGLCYHVPLDGMGGFYS